MKLKTLEIRRRRKEYKKAMTDQTSAQIEKKLLIELKAKLEVELESNEKVLLEVHPKVSGEFQNILADEILSMYRCEQVDANKYIFSNEEMDI